MFKQLKNIEVFLNEVLIGELAILPNKEIGFEYDNNFIKQGYSISPFFLALKSGVQIAKQEPFNGLFGVFSDSLPDGWGNLLVDRFLNNKGINPRELNILERLSLLNNNAMGALSYKPTQYFNSTKESWNFDKIFDECKSVLENKDIANIDNLFKQGGSNGGARPKIYYTDDTNQEYIIKFQSQEDGTDIGAIEYVYSLMAKKAGIDIPETQLIPSINCPGYFKVKRFDRKHNKKIHMHSIAGLCNLNFRLPALDYKDLLSITMELTKDIVEVKKMFRLAVFNISTSNKDDHSKNFAFLYKNSKWQLSPAFDLTYSEGFNSEHNTMFMGKGKNITYKDIYKLGKEYSLGDNFIKDTIDKIFNSLSNWNNLAKTYGVKTENIKKIANKLLLPTIKNNIYLEK